VRPEVGDVSEAGDLPQCKAFPSPTDDEGDTGLLDGAGPEPGVLKREEPGPGLGFAREQALDDLDSLG
jgi:hypothetical protein